MTRTWTWVFAGVGSLSLASLLLPYAPGYDPWAWMVWGREIGELALDTTAGPSWKPLPVLATTGLAPLGDLGAELWLALARAGWMLSLVLAFVLARRLSPPTASGPIRLAAGATGALGVLLLSDEITAWPRQAAIGLSEPVLVALVLGAIERDGVNRRGQALALGAAAALLRPEVWPLLGAYALWVCAREPHLRAPAVAGAVGIPLLWFVPDLLGAGDPLEGASRAREGAGAPGGELVESLDWSWQLALPALWVSAGAGVWLSHRAGRSVQGALAVGAIAWIAIVGLLAAAGYAGLPRFSAPAGAIICVLGGSGIAWLAVESRARTWVSGLLVALVIWLLAGGSLRAERVPGQLAGVVDLAESEADLAAVAGAARPAATRCERVAATDPLFETQLAWELGVPIARIGVTTRPEGLDGLVFVDGSAPARVGSAAKNSTPVASSDLWSVYAFGC